MAVALSLAVLFILDWRTAIIANSGMEAMLFICFQLLVLYFLQKDKRIEISAGNVGKQIMDSNGEEVSQVIIPETAYFLLELRKKSVRESRRLFVKPAAVNFTEIQKRLTQVEKNSFNLLVGQKLFTSVVICHQKLFAPLPSFLRPRWPRPCPRRIRSQFCP